MDDMETRLCCYVRKSVITEDSLYPMEIPDAFTIMDENVILRFCRLYLMEIINTTAVMDVKPDIMDENLL